MLGKKVHSNPVILLFIHSFELYTPHFQIIIQGGQAIPPQHIIHGTLLATNIYTFLFVLISYSVSSNLLFYNLIVKQVPGNMDV